MTEPYKPLEVEGYDSSEYVEGYEPLEVEGYGESEYVEGYKPLEVEGYKPLEVDSVLSAIGRGIGGFVDRWDSLREDHARYKETGYMPESLHPHPLPEPGSLTSDLPEGYRQRVSDSYTRFQRGYYGEYPLGFGDDRRGVLLPKEAIGEWGFKERMRGATKDGLVLGKGFDTLDSVSGDAFLRFREGKSPELLSAERAMSEELGGVLGVRHGASVHRQFQRGIDYVPGRSEIIGRDGRFVWVPQLDRDVRVGTFKTKTKKFAGGWWVNEKDFDDAILYRDLLSRKMYESGEKGLGDGYVAPLIEKGVSLTASGKLFGAGQKLLGLITLAGAVEEDRPVSNQVISAARTAVDVVDGVRWYVDTDDANGRIIEYGADQYAKLETLMKNGDLSDLLTAGTKAVVFATSFYAGRKLHKMRTSGRLKGRAYAGAKLTQYGATGLALTGSEALFNNDSFSDAAFWTDANWYSDFMENTVEEVKHFVPAVIAFGQMAWKGAGYLAGDESAIEKSKATLDIAAPMASHIAHRAYDFATDYGEFLRPGLGKAVLDYYMFAGVPKAAVRAYAKHMQQTYEARASTAELNNALWEKAEHSLNKGVPWDDIEWPVPRRASDRLRSQSPNALVPVPGAITNDLRAKLEKTEVELDGLLKASERLEGGKALAERDLIIQTGAKRIASDRLKEAGSLGKAIQDEISGYSEWLPRAERQAGAEMFTSVRSYIKDLDNLASKIKAHANAKAVREYYDEAIELQKSIESRHDHASITMYRQSKQTSGKLSELEQRYKAGERKPSAQEQMDRLENLRVHYRDKQVAERKLAVDAKESARVLREERADFVHAERVAASELKDAIGMFPKKGPVVPPTIQRQIGLLEANGSKSLPPITVQGPLQQGPTALIGARRNPFLGALQGADNNLLLGDGYPAVKAINELRSTWGDIRTIEDIKWVSSRVKTILSHHESHLANLRKNAERQANAVKERKLELLAASDNFDSANRLYKEASARLATHGKKDFNAADEIALRKARIKNLELSIAQRVKVDINPKLRGKARESAAQLIAAEETAAYLGNFLSEMSPFVGGFTLFNSIKNSVLNPSLATQGSFPLRHKYAYWTRDRDKRMVQSYTAKVREMQGSAVVHSQEMANILQAVHKKGGDELVAVFGRLLRFDQEEYKAAFTRNLDDLYTAAESEQRIASAFNDIVLLQSAKNTGMRAKLKQRIGVIDERLEHAKTTLETLSEDAAVLTKIFDIKRRLSESLVGLTSKEQQGRISGYYGEAAPLMRLLSPTTLEILLDLRPREAKRWRKRTGKPKKMSTRDMVAAIYGVKPSRRGSAEELAHGMSKVDDLERTAAGLEPGPAARRIIEAMLVQQKGAPQLRQLTELEESVRRRIDALNSRRGKIAEKLDESDAKFKRAFDRYEQVSRPRSPVNEQVLVEKTPFGKLLPKGVLKSIPRQREVIVRPRYKIRDDYTGPIPRKALEQYEKMMNTEGAAMIDHIRHMTRLLAEENAFWDASKLDDLYYPSNLEVWVPKSSSTIAATLESTRQMFKDIFTRGDDVQIIADRLDQAAFAGGNAINAVALKVNKMRRQGLTLEQQKDPRLRPDYDPAKAGRGEYLYLVEDTVKEITENVSTAYYEAANLRLMRDLQDEAQVVKPLNRPLDNGRWEEGSRIANKETAGYWGERGHVLVLQQMPNESAKAYAKRVESSIRDIYKGGITDRTLTESALTTLGKVKPFKESMPRAMRRVFPKVTKGSNGEWWTTGLNRRLIAVENPIVEGTRVNKMGTMNGMLEPNVAYEIVYSRRWASAYRSIAGRVNTWFKGSKTILSPSAHGNNFLSNMLVLSPLAKMEMWNPANWQYYAAAAYDMAFRLKKSKDYLEFEQHGGTGFGVIHRGEAYAEASRAIGKLYNGVFGSALSKATDGAKVLSKIVDASMDIYANGMNAQFPKTGLGKFAKDLLWDTPGNIYQAGDDFYRYAMYKKLKAEHVKAKTWNALNRRKTIDAVRKAYADYENLAGAFHWMRSSIFGKPFVAFNARMLPQVNKYMAENPYRLRSWLLAGDHVKGLSAANIGIDEEALDLIPQMLPHYEGDKMVSLARLTGDVGDLLTFWDTAKMVPGADYLPKVRRKKETAFDWFKRVGLSSSPILGTYLDIFGKDHHYGTALYGGALEGYTSGDQLSAIIQRTLMRFSPSFTGIGQMITPDSWHGIGYGEKRVSKAEAGMPRFGRDSAEIPLLAKLATRGGIRLAKWPMDEYLAWVGGMSARSQRKYMRAIKNLQYKYANNEISEGDYQNRFTILLQLGERLQLEHGKATRAAKAVYEALEDK